MRNRIAHWQAAAEGALLPAALIGGLAWLISGSAGWAAVALPILGIGTVFLWLIDPRQEVTLQDSSVHVIDKTQSDDFDLGDVTTVSSSPSGTRGPVMLYLDGPNVHVGVRSQGSPGFMRDLALYLSRSEAGIDVDKSTQLLLEGYLPRQHRRPGSI